VHGCAAGRQRLGLPVPGAAAALSVQEHQTRLCPDTVLQCYSCSGCQRAFSNRPYAAQHVRTCGSKRQRHLSSLWTVPQLHAVAQFWVQQGFVVEGSLGNECNSVAAAMPQHGKALHAAVLQAMSTALLTVLSASQCVTALLALQQARRAVLRNAAPVLVGQTGSFVLLDSTVVADVAAVPAPRCDGSAGTAGSSGVDVVGMQM